LTFREIALADSADAGSIVGDVKFTEAPPQLQPIRVTKDQDYCGETLPNETYLIHANGALKNVVVFIESAPAGKPANAQKENFLYNDGCRYAPHVLAFQKGERLRVKSHDPKLHIPHGCQGRNDESCLRYPRLDAGLRPRLRSPALRVFYRAPFF